MSATAAAAIIATTGDHLNDDNEQTEHERPDDDPL